MNRGRAVPLWWKRRLETKITELGYAGQLIPMNSQLKTEVTDKGRGKRRYCPLLCKGCPAEIREIVRAEVMNKHSVSWDLLFVGLGGWGDGGPCHSEMLQPQRPFVHPCWSVSQREAFFGSPLPSQPALLLPRGLLPSPVHILRESLWSWIVVWLGCVLFAA